MAFVPTRTDQTEHSGVDGKVPAFGATIEAGASGFGIRTTVKGVEVFEVIDALPLNRPEIRAAVEAGTTSAAAVAAGVTAIDFATFDMLTAAEVATAAGIKAGQEITIDGGPMPTIITVIPTAEVLNEGDTIRFNITGGPPNTAITLGWSGTFDQTVNSSGVADVFYTAATSSDGGQSTLPGDPFQTSLTLDATGAGWWQTSVQNDATTEGAETLTLTVSAAGYTGDSATVTILDTSTTPPAISVTTSASEVNEGAAVTFTVSNGPANTAVLFTWTGTATRNVDTDFLPGEVGLNATGAVNMDVIMIEDMITEGDETLTLTVSAAGFADGSATVTIKDTSTA